MKEPISQCVVLADPHHGLAEGIRGLLQLAFATVVMVADENSLVESASKLKPALAVVDLSLGPRPGFGWLARLREACPRLKVIIISVHDERSVARSARAAGAEGFVLKRHLSDELIPAVHAVLAGGHYP